MTTTAIDTKGSPMSASVSVMSDRFTTLLRDVVRAAGNDSALPMIAGLQLYTAEGQLVAQATDRFCLLHGHAPILSGALPVVWLTGAQVRQILAVLRPFTSRRRSGVAEVVVSVKDGQVLVEQPALDDLGGIDLRFPHQTETNFPDLAKLIQRHLSEEPSGDSYTVDPGRLVVFAQIAKARSELMQVQSRGARRPIVVEIGSDLLGILMPVNRGAEREQPLSVQVFAPPVLDDAKVA